MRNDDATPRYTRWCNGLTEAQLMSHRFRDCTLIQPTWFMSRRAFERSGGYEESGLAEDLKMLYAHIERGGGLRKVPEALLLYRYRPGSVTFRVPRDLLRTIRVRAFERQILDARPEWQRFYIWGAGRNGRAFYQLRRRRRAARMRTAPCRRLTGAPQRPASASSRKGCGFLRC